MKKLLLTILITNFLFATTPPKSGKIPPHIQTQLEKIREGYTEGYWAEKFQKKYELVSKLGVNAFKQVVAADTIFVPVLFGSYSDASAKHAISVFQEMLFDGPNPTRTLTEFYTEMSYGKLLMSGNCLGWYKLPRTHDYYVHDGGDRNAGLVFGGADFVIDVMIKSDSSVDYSKYVESTDANYAYVPYIGVYHTGSDAAAGGDNIWSHRSNIRWRLSQRKTNDPAGLVKPENVLSNNNYKTNDTYFGKPVVIVGDYAIQPELSGSNNSNGKPKPIGVTAHEFGHIFGLPDLYDTDNSSAGIGNWCLMAGGSYGADGSHEDTPAHMSAWCKERLSWVIPQVLNNFSKDTKVSYVEKNPEIFKIFPKATPGSEYFLIENRQRFGFDKYLMETGLFIWHIDNNGSQSNENRRRVDLEQADGLRQLNTSTTRGDAGDPFPGSSNNRNFDGYTNPNSISNLNAQTYVGVRKISNSDTVMTVNFDMGTRPYVMAKSVLLQETTEGNKNGRVDPGENGKIFFELQNAYPTIGNDLTIDISCNSEFIKFDTSRIIFSINSLETKTIKLNGSVFVNANQPVKKEKFEVKITSPEEVLIYNFDIQIGYPKILVVSSDTVLNENILTRYPIHLAKYGKDYEIIKNTSINDIAQIQRDVIIWTHGRKKVNTISNAEGDTLLAFLAKGGRLFLNGQNFAEDFFNRGSNLSQKILRANFSKNVLIGATLFGVPYDMIGKQFSKITFGGNGSIGNQNSRDELLVDTLIAHPIFRWNNATTGAYGGVWWEDNITKSKVVYLAFGLEAVNDSIVGQATSYDLLSKILDYLQTPTGVDEKLNLPLNFSLANNYPNPFNPTTTIKFTLPQTSEVKLIVRDLLGREIKTLSQGKLHSGEHKINFDASGLSAGFYLYTLKTENKEITKKMLLVK